MSTAKGIWSVSYARIFRRIIACRSGDTPISWVPLGGVPGAGHRVSRRQEHACYDSRFPMLRAALIGLGSSGKTTLFQLMTSIKDSPKAGKGDIAIGISKVPD